MKIKDTGDPGVVVGVDHCLAGTLYRVLCGRSECSNLPRDALEYLGTGREGPVLMTLNT